MGPPFSIANSNSAAQPGGAVCLMVAGGQGFEPRLADPESAVLPLDDPPMALPCYRMVGRDAMVEARQFSTRARIRALNRVASNCAARSRQYSAG
jgi:hypothetical protein